MTTPLIAGMSGCPDSIQKMVEAFITEAHADNQRAIGGETNGFAWEARHIALDVWSFRLA